MELFTIFEVLLILFFTVSILNHYSAKDVHIFHKILIIIGWFLSFVTIALLPLDVYYTLHHENESPATRGFNGSQNKNNDKHHSNYDTMVSVWNFVYWTAFVWTWVILPIVSEYSTAGDFTFKEKLKTSLRINGYYYGIMAAIGLMFLLYLVATGKIFNQGIVEVLITFSNVFGIVQIILCLGYGLVYIPKRYFLKTNNELNLRLYQGQACVVEEQRKNLQFEVDELIKLLLWLKDRKDICPENLKPIEIILEYCPKELVKTAKETMNPSFKPIRMKDFAVLSMPKIIDLNQEVKKKINALKRSEIKWDILLKNAFFLEDIMESEHSIDWRIRSAFYVERRGKCGKILDNLEWLWFVRLRIIMNFIFGVLSILGSVAVFIFEVFTFEEFNVVNLNILSKEDGFIKTQIVCLIPLLYISFCVYSALFNMKIFSFYGLYPHHQTDTASLVFTAMNFSRVSGPLVFNFLQMMKIKGTAFQAVMGDATLAYSFTAYFPIILIALCIFSLFDVYGRLMSGLGLSKYRFNEEYDEETIEQGKKILYKARNSRERNILVLNSTNLKSYHNYSAKMKLREYESLDYEKGVRKSMLHDLQGSSDKLLTSPRNSLYSEFMNTRRSRKMSGNMNIKEQ